MIRLFSDERAIRRMMEGLVDRILSLRAWDETPNAFVSHEAREECHRMHLDAQRAGRQLRRALDRRFPKVVTLCGSTRFKATFESVNFEETMAGNLVISLGVFGHADMPNFDWTSEDGQRIKAELDVLHHRKIDLADEILVINVDGYIGDSTRSEIAYAQSTGKAVRYLEDPVVHYIRKELEQ